VKDLMKLAPLVQGLPLSTLGYVLVLGLLVRQVVTFEEAVILILIAILIERFKSPRSRTRDGSVSGKGSKAK
jgi:hypothetical protein